VVLCAAAVANAGPPRFRHADDVHPIHNSILTLRYSNTMSRMDSVQQSSQAPTPTLPGDVVSALNTLHDFVAAATSIPPQIVVTCRDEKRAFGRVALQSMSYRKAVDMFITRFATKEDWWISEYRYKPEVTIYGRFYRQHGEDDDGMIILDERGWSELVGNVVKMTIIFTSLKFTVTAQSPKP